MSPKGQARQPLPKAMTPATVRVRPFKEAGLRGGTLLVSVPHAGIANILLTDFVLQQLEMDQVAALDSDAFPPFAMVHRGRARFPARIHANAESRLAVLRCEFSPPAQLARPLGQAVLAWAEAEGVARTVVLDGLHVVPGEVDLGAAPTELPKVWFVAAREETRREAAKAGIAEFGDGVLDNLTAVLLLEARFQKADVVALLAERRDPLDEARGVLALARQLPALVPGLDLDLPTLEARLAEVEVAVGQARLAAEKALERMRTETAPPTAMYT